jgi:phosphate starvation-inducible PhoH-like protein
LKTHGQAATSGDAVERLVLEDNQTTLAVLGERNANLKRLEAETGAAVHSRGNEITCVGTPAAVAMARKVLEGLYPMARSGRFLKPEDVTRAATVLRSGQTSDIQGVLSDTILVANRGRAIAPKGVAQKSYVDAIRRDDIVFGIGPAGTGKTYLAMALAVRALLEKKVKRIVLTRPAVEAGERLGFLPGSMEEKVSPYLRPLYDALHDMMDFDKADQLIGRDLIEIAPLAFMRGRTLNDAFVILDEAQNATGEQMQMFLTRLGFESNAVITGDVTQVDLPDNKRSGLMEAQHILRDIPGITFCYFTEVDVVRHPLVQQVIKAYDRHRSGRESGRLLDSASRRDRPEIARSPPEAEPATLEGQRG